MSTYKITLKRENKSYEQQTLYNHYSLLWYTQRKLFSSIGDCFYATA